MAIRVRDLIAQLQQLPADAIVVIEGYEDGFDEIASIELGEVRHLPNSVDWAGEYRSEEPPQPTPVPEVWVIHEELAKEWVGASNPAPAVLIKGRRFGLR